MNIVGILGTHVYKWKSDIRNGEREDKGKIGRAEFNYDIL
jgi:hypothetical protein